MDRVHEGEERAERDPRRISDGRLVLLALPGGAPAKLRLWGGRGLPAAKIPFQGGQGGAAPVAPPVGAPQDYTKQVDTLLVCEFCLKYMKTRRALDKHLQQCTVYHPPGAPVSSCCCPPRFSHLCLPGHLVCGQVHWFS